LYFLITIAEQIWNPDAKAEPDESWCLENNEANNDFLTDFNIFVITINTCYAR
jgi:hypothetical protein